MNADGESEFHVCYARTGGDWQKLGERSETADDPLSELRRFLGEILRTRNLSVLAAAGVSLGVWRSIDSETRKSLVEPTRQGLWRMAADTWQGDFDELLSIVNFDKDLGSDVEALLSQCSLASKFINRTDIQDFLEECERGIVRACKFVSDSVDLSSHEVFLRKVGRRSRRLPRLKVFTTNYDQCFERAAQNIRFVVVDGFSHMIPQEFDASNFDFDYVVRKSNDEPNEYIPNVIQLQKLHGSVDWSRKGHEIVKSESAERPLLIYPRSTKYESSYKPPFLEMISRFQQALREPNSALIIAGYGFADNHLTEPILSAIRSNVGLRVVVVDPGLGEMDENKTRGRLRELIKNGDSRICLISAKFDQFSRILPDAEPQSELDSHLDRIKGF